MNLKNEVGIETLLRELGAMRAETNKRFEVLERTMRGDRIRAEIPIKKPGGPLGPFVDDVAYGVGDRVRHLFLEEVAAVRPRDGRARKEALHVADDAAEHRVAISPHDRDRAVEGRDGVLRRRSAAIDACCMESGTMRASASGATRSRNVTERPPVAERGLPRMLVLSPCANAIVFCGKPRSEHDVGDHGQAREAMEARWRGSPRAEVRAPC